MPTSSSRLTIPVNQAVGDRDGEWRANLLRRAQRQRGARRLDHLRETCPPTRRPANRPTAASKRRCAVAAKNPIPTFGSAFDVPCHPRDCIFPLLVAGTPGAATSFDRLVSASSTRPEETSAAPALTAIGTPGASRLVSASRCATASRVWRPIDRGSATVNRAGQRTARHRPRFSQRPT
jgi:hypothetical protein